MSIEVSTNSAKVEVDTTEVGTGFTDAAISTENSAYMEVNPAEYALTSGGIYGGGGLVGAVPEWLQKAIQTELTTGEGNLTDVVNGINTFIATLEAGVDQSIQSINTSLESTNSLLTTVNSKVDNNQAYVTDILTTKATKDEALAIAIQQQESVFGPDALATVGSIAATYTDANSAIAQDLDLVSATLGDVSATVTTHDYAIVTEIPNQIASLESTTGVSIAELQAQVDGNIVTWFQDLGATRTPTTTDIPWSDWIATDTLNGNIYEQLAHVGDLFYNTFDGQAYRFAYEEIDANPGKDFGWLVVTDNAIALALDAAANAQSTADGKRTVYYLETPPITGVDVGDINVDPVTKITQVWNGSSWEDITNTNTEEALSRIGEINLALVQNEIDKANLDGRIDSEESARIAGILAEEQARIADISAQLLVNAELDGKITDAEQSVVDASDALTLAYQEYSDTVAQALIDGEITDAEQNAIDAAQGLVDTATTNLTSAISAVDLTAEQAYEWSAGASKFVTDPYGVITGWSFSSSSEEPSIFKVNSESFELIDSLNNRAVMTSDGLAFYKAGVDSPYKMVSKIETGVAENNSLVTLSGFYNTPSVIVSQNSILSYKADYSSQNQKWVVRAQNLTGSTVTGNWTFTPLAQLILDNATKSESLSSSSNSSSDTIYSSYYQTPLETKKISVTGYVNSSRSTGTSGQYYKRKCVVTLQTSLNASSWVDEISSTIYFGSDLSQDYFSLFKDVTQGQYYYRVKFIYSDDTGTFSVGTSYNYYTRTVTQPTTNLVVDVQTSGPTFEADSMTCSYNLLPNESVVSGTYSYNWNTTYIRAIASYSSSGGSSYTESLVYNSINGKGFSNYNVNHGRMTTASSTGTSSIDRGVSTGYKSSDTTATSFSVIAESTTTGYSGSGDVQVTISNMTLTLNTRIPVTSSTTANNYFGALNASYELGTTTYLDENGILNYLAIG